MGSGVIVMSVEVSVGVDAAGILGGGGVRVFVVGVVLVGGGEGVGVGVVGVVVLPFVAGWMVLVGCWGRVGVFHV